MSSILKALKKIDKTSPSKGDGHPWPTPGETRETITRSIQRRWLIRRTTTYVLVAACVVSLAVLFYLRYADKLSGHHAAGPRSRAETNRSPVHRDKIAPPLEGQTSGLPVTQKEPPGTRKTNPKITVPQNNKSERAVSSIPEVQPKVRPKVIREPAPSNKGLPKKSLKTATKKMPPASETKVPAGSGNSAAAKPVTAPRSESTRQYSRLQNTSLTLQAIAWSPQPSERIAVINGSIVKEGESVEGFTLMRIRKDDIVLNDGNKTWQLEFGLRR